MQIHERSQNKERKQPGDRHMRTNPKEATMKTQALMRMCKKKKTARIITDENTNAQWIEVVGNVYPLDGMPYMDKETLLTMMDVPEDKKAEYSIGEVPLTPSAERWTANNEGSDHPAKKGPITIAMDGEVYRPVYTCGGVVLVPEASFGPVKDSEDTHELFSREIGGNTWVLVKNGFLLQAAIGRAIIRNAEVADCLHDVACHVSQEIAKKQKEELEENGEQQSI